MPEQHETNPSVVSTPAPGNQESATRPDRLMHPTQSHLPDTPGPLTTRTNSPQRIPYWLQQAERFLRVIVRIYLGLLVCFAPWYPPAWEANPLFSQSPGLLHFIMLGAVRGIVSGLGLLNLWIALGDALHGSPDSDSH